MSIYSPTRYVAENTFSYCTSPISPDYDTRTLKNAFDCRIL